MLQLLGNFIQEHEWSKMQQKTNSINIKVDMPPFNLPELSDFTSVLLVQMKYGLALTVSSSTQNS